MATTHLQGALAIRRAEADEGGCAEVLQLLGETALRRGELEGSTTLCAESLRLYRRVSDRAGIAHVLPTLGNVARLEGTHDRATRLNGLNLHSLLVAFVGAVILLAIVMAV